MADAPIRYTKAKASIELSWFKYLVLIPLWRLSTWGLRRSKPVLYHPIALIGIALAVALSMLSPLLVVAALLAVPLWAREWPDSYFRHGHPRIVSFIAGFGYRWQLRKKLKGCNLLFDHEPLPTVSYVTRVGCITTARIKMSYGDEIDLWRAKLTPQTFNALDVTINPHRRKTLVPWKSELVTKPRWVNLEFLTKDPFSSQLGVEYVNYHRAETLSPVVATYRTGAPHSDNLAAHRLRIALTRWGKSNANRATIYAQRHNLAAGLLEIWLIDGKGGVEGAFLEHCVARRAYGDVEADPEGYDPAEFDQLLKDAVTVMMKRQKAMRGFVTEHVPTPDAPWLRIVIDEILVLTSTNVPTEMRNRIAANVNLIFQQGVACGVTIDASSQLGTKDDLKPINRAGFTEFEIGKVERGVVDMIFGSGWWDRGARADEIADDLKGVFYRKTESTMAPQEIRYPAVTVPDLNTMPAVRESVLWKPAEPSYSDKVLMA